MTWFRPTKLPIDPFGTADSGFKTMRVTSPYGTRPDPLGQTPTVFHGGLDIGNARLGDAVTAVAAGQVIIADNQPHPHFNQASPLSMRKVWGPSYGGLMVVIRHPSGFQSQYAHLGAKAVDVDDRVLAGQIIGAVGDSGSAHGMGHLHHGIRDPQRINNGHDGWIDPWPLLDPTTHWEDPLVIADLKTDLAACRARNAELTARKDALLAITKDLEDQIDVLEPLAAQVPALQAKIKQLRIAVVHQRKVIDELEAA